jgi:hypothetical protein
VRPIVRLGLGLFATIGSQQAAGQDSVSVQGHVVRQSARGPVPLAGVMVTLHRIARASAGPIDSLTTDRQGTYRFRVAADSESMYLATSRHGGIAYFAPPTRLGEEGGESEIVVFDTTTAPVSLRIAGRHVIVSAPAPDGRRELVEVYEIQNDSIVTQVSPSRDRPTFRTVLPAGARNVRTTQGDFTGDAVAFDDGVALVLAPIAPGVRQLVLSYEMGPEHFPLSLGTDAPADVLEVLLEEASGRVEGPALAAQGPVTVDGRAFVRFLGRDVPAGAAVQIVLPTRSARRMPSWLPGVALGLLSLGVIALVMRPRRIGAPAVPIAAPGPVQEQGPAGWSAAQLREAIAGVDQALAAATTVDAARPALRSYRRELEDALARSLAAAPEHP